MFSNNQGEGKGRSAEDSSSKAINLVGSATTIKGEVTTESDIRVDGRIEGDLHTHTKIVLGEGGVIEGNVYCESADLSGQVSGNIYCKELLKLQATTQVQGDILTKRAVVEKGAVFNGQCTMQDQITFPDQPGAQAKEASGQSSAKSNNLGKVKEEA